MKYGKHIIIDAYGCEKKKLWSKETIKYICRRLTEDIGLQIIAYIPVCEVIEGDRVMKKDVGITGGAIFIANHFIFHSFPNKQLFSADIYSCKNFKETEILKIFKEVYNPKKMDTKIILRGSNFERYSSKKNNTLNYNKEKKRIKKVFETKDKNTN